jgi:hypothetical protein
MQQQSKIFFKAGHTTVVILVRPWAALGLHMIQESLRPFCFFSNLKEGRSPYCMDNGAKKSFSWQF